MKKLYLPRHYGIEHFGEPDKIKISKCYDINLKFKGSLRENQLKPVNAFLKSCEEEELIRHKVMGVFYHYLVDTERPYVLYIY